MSKTISKTLQNLSAQPLLIDTAIEEGAHDISLGFRQKLSRVISASGKDRYAIAGEVSRLTKTNFSKDMLDKYTSSDMAYGIRAEIMTAFAYVTNSLEPFRYLLEPLGSDVLKPGDRDLIELARLQEERQTIDTRIMQIRQNRGLK